MQLPGQRQPVEKPYPKKEISVRPFPVTGQGQAPDQFGVRLTTKQAAKPSKGLGKAISIETGPPRWPHGFGWERARLLRHFRQQFAFCRRAAQPEKQKEEAQKKSNAGNANKKVHGFYTLMLMILRMISTPMVIIPRPA